MAGQDPIGVLLSVGRVVLNEAGAHGVDERVPQVRGKVGIDGLPHQVGSVLRVPEGLTQDSGEDIVERTLEVLAPLVGAGADDLLVDDGGLLFRGLASNRLNT